MNNHKRTCEMSAIEWASSIPPKCTCDEKTYEEELRKEWEAYSTSFGYVFGNNDTADWWLSKLDTYKSELLSKIDRLKIPPEGIKEKAIERYSSYNQAIDEILNLIKEGKE